METWYPIFVLIIGIAVVLGCIVLLRANAFLALITAAMVVSLLAPGAPQEKIGRVATAFGSAAGGIGIVIALAAVIGQCMLESGAADRIVRSFVKTLGEKRAPLALMLSGYVLSIPVFFDTVFYLMVPLARSLYRTTGRNYLTYLLAICAGGVLTHTLVPPTPGPLMMAAQLQVNLGTMMLVGGIIALPAALVGLFLCGWFDRKLQIPMRKLPHEPDWEPIEDHRLPPLFWSILPVILPVILISANTALTSAADNEHAARITVNDIDWQQLPAVLAEAQRPEAERTPRGRVAARMLELVDDPQLSGATQWDDQQRAQIVAVLNDRVLRNRGFYRASDFAEVAQSDTSRRLLASNDIRMKVSDIERMNRSLLEDAMGGVVAAHVWETPLRKLSNWSDLVGNANLALLISAVIAMVVLLRQRQLSLETLATSVETSLMSGGVIILITSAGGAFGKMLEYANVGAAVQSLFINQAQGSSAGMLLLMLGFGVSMVLKIAQGSSTVAMITGASMLASVATPEALGFHPVYLATAIGGGSLVGSWMNDSGFWIFAKMGGLTEAESLKTWTPMLAIVGVTSFVISLIMARFVPLV